MSKPVNQADLRLVSAQRKRKLHKRGVACWWSMQHQAFVWRPSWRRLPVQRARLLGTLAQLTSK